MTLAVQIALGLKRAQSIAIALGTLQVGVIKTSLGLRRVPAVNISLATIQTEVIRAALGPAKTPYYKVAFSFDQSTENFMSHVLETFAGEKIKTLEGAYITDL